MADINGTENADYLSVVSPSNINGLGGDDTLMGSTGTDYLYGGEGNDFLYGYDGTDYLIGGAGNDTLVGSTGSDFLYGDAGADQFFFFSLVEATQGGIDHIADFDYLEGDTIGIYAPGFGASSTSQFTYDNSTGGLFFEQTQFASLQPNLNRGFNPSLDITF